MADKENNNALDEAQIKQILTNIPNNVSGDGKVFVAALKNYLVKSGLLTNKKIDDNTSSAGEKPGHVSSLQLLELHSITDGVRINSIQVSWVKTTVTNYAKAEVWFRTATDKAWEKAGESSGTQFVYSGATTGLTYYIKVVAVNTKGNAADFETAPQASIKIQGSQYIPNPPTQFVLTWDEKGPLWKWLFEPNEYIDFFELRLDQNPGVWNDKRLDSTRETWSRANPGVRSGTAYLYIRNIFGEYSEPAVHEFNKALPQKPTAPQLTSTIDGVRIKMQGLPLGATGYKIHIKTTDSKETVEDDFFTVNSEYIYFFFIGHITVKYCFVDPLGDGEWSDTSEADCKAGIDIGQVPTIDYTKFDKFTQDAIDKANNQPSINEDLKKLIDANTNGIHQNEDSITSVVKRVDTAEGTLKTQGTAIQQNANSISTIAMDVKGNTSAIEQNAKSITAIVEDVRGNKASIQANADNITSIVTKVDKQGSTIDKQGSAIVQNANSITSVVTELNKKPADCNYSSINQLQDDILLCVKKDGVINAINVSTEGIVIDGNKVHITGDTVFDNNVIVGGMIAADSIALEHLKANSVSTAKIQANAITSTKIGAGAVTADKIEAGAITAEKLAADSVTSDAIQAGSVIGDKIAANTITGKHFAAANIDLTGALAVVGGAVRLSQEGLRCSESSGGYTLFDERGITFYDANDNQYAQLHRICVGTAAHGQKVTFAAPWKNTPSVVCIPTELQCNEANYAQSNVFIICRATNVTVNGFSVECYTRLGEGSNTTIPYNEDFVGATTENIKTIDKYNIEAYFDKELPVPKSATEGAVAAELTSLAAGSKHVGDHQTTYSKTTRAYKMQIIYQENIIAESEYTPLPQTHGDNYREKLKTRQNLRFSLPSAVDYETKVTLRIVLALYKRRGYSHNNPTSVTLESDEVILISASYNSGSFAISTGVAAFVAIENGSNDYSLS